jgi:cell division protein FtsW (lipid II flippase)
MASILIIIFILLFVFIFAISLVLSLVRRFISLFRKPKSDKHGTSSHKKASSGSYGKAEWDTQGASYNENRKKVLFEKDEGEYVDFEEIKD